MHRPSRPSTASSGRSRSAVVSAAVLLLAGIPPRAAVASQVPSAEPPPDTLPGELHAELVSVSDSTERYALLLPDEWEGARRRPLLLVLDPRGRAVRALERFRSAAGLGWLAMSSYGTRSDTDEPGVNERALRAMLADAEELLPVDPDRVYLAGFSGTARLGWFFAASLSPHVAGMIGVGAGFPAGLAAVVGADLDRLPDHFAFWGGSGRVDFNYEEVRDLDALLDGAGVRHRIDHYEGPHAWPPPERAAEAVAWLELAAMGAGLAPVRTGWVDSLRTVWTRRARRALAAGDTAEAAERWRRVAEDFDGIAPVPGARDTAEALADTDPVRRARERRERQRAEHRAFGDRFWPLVERLRGGDPPAAGEVAEQLGLRGLRRRAAGSDRTDAEQAARLLEIVYVQTSFYLPREALRRGDPDRALVALRVAEAARPGRPRTCLFRARAHATAGRADEAFEAIACVRRRGPLPAELLRDDSRLAPLRDDPRWAEALARLP